MVYAAMPFVIPAGLVTPAQFSQACVSFLSLPLITLGEII